MNKYPRRIKYEIGQKFEGFTIVNPAPTKIAASGKTYTCWECKCDCGQIFITTTKQIRRGVKKSCGCKSKSNRFKSMSDDRVVANHKFSHYKCSAVKRKIKMDLTLEQFTLLLFGDCFYCKSAPSTFVTLKKHKSVVNGVDRLNSSVGYSSGNCVSCCKICNRAKGDMHVLEFQQWIKNAAA